MATTTRESRLARAERLAQGPIKVRWDRVAAMALAIAALATVGGMFYVMLSMFLDGAM